MFEGLLAQGKSLLVKLFLGLIALSFAVWGIGDVFRGGSDPSVASVGGVEIRASELSRQYNRELQRLRAATNGEIDAEQARALGIVQQTLISMIARTALDRQAADFAMGVADETVRQEIRSRPEFRNEIGRFDRQIFNLTLARAQFSEEEYIAILRTDIARDHLTGSLSGGLVPPEPMMDALYRFREERRIVEAVVIDAKDVTDVPTPEAAEVAAYHGDNPDLFTAPEYRALTYVTLRPIDLVDEIEIDTAVIEAEYDARLDEFTVQSRVDVDMLVFPDEAAALAAQSRILDGEDFVAVGTELTGFGAEDIKLGEITRDDMLPEIADAVFALTAGAVAPPVQSSFGWHLVRVNETFPGRVQSFDEVRAQVREDLVVDQAIDAVFELGNRFEDELAGGASLAEAARALDLEVGKISAIDRRGLGEDGKPYDPQPAVPDFLDAAFDTALDEESGLIESVGNIMFLVRVDRITAPAVRPLDTIADEVARAWRGAYRLTRAEEIAGEIATAAAAASGDLGASARAAGFETMISAAFTRDGRDLDLDLGGQLVGAVFGLEPGAVSEATAIGGGRFAIARLSGIVPADPADGASRRDALRAEIRRNLEIDLLNTFEGAVRAAYGYKINTQLVDNLF